MTTQQLVEQWKRANTGNFVACPLCSTMTEQACRKRRATMRAWAVAWKWGASVAGPCSTCQPWKEKRQ